MKNAVRERIRIEKGAIVEIEIEAEEDYVERRMNQYLSTNTDIMVIKGRSHKVEITSDQLFLPGFSVDDAPILVQSTGAPENPSGILNGSNHTQTPEDLTALYSSYFAKEKPEKQFEVICFVTYVYQYLRGYSVLTLKDYEDAFFDLRRAAITTPQDLRSSIKNARKAKYLFSPTEGKFALTIKGEELVRQLMNQS